MDLRGGTVSYIGTAELELEVPYGNGSGDYTYEYTGFPIGIAEGTVIENATTGSGNDSITCNVAANNITCGDGNDDVFNIGSGDYIFGGHGYDSFWVISLDFASIRAVWVPMSSMVKVTCLFSMTMPVLRLIFVLLPMPN